MTKGDGLISRQSIGLVLGLLIAIGLQIVGPPQSALALLETPEAARRAWIVLSLLSLMAIWWVSEAIPIPVTSLLPIIILPMADVQSVQATTTEYFHRVVVLLLGGFIIAKAIERWNLHRRIALNVVVRAGNSPALIVGGFMIAAAALSMWISNTATSIMMMPIALSVAVAVLGEEKLDAPFTWSLLLGIAWACSIGGLGTPVGTPTNLIVMGFLEDLAGVQIGFGQWMSVGLPSVVILLPLAWIVLTRLAFKVRAIDGAGGQEIVRRELGKLGEITTPEVRTLFLFATVACLWIFRRPLQGLDIAGVAPFGGLTDHVTAIIGVVLCFLIPSGSKEQPRSALLDWKTAEGIPWGVILLFGGGMTLAKAITVSGLGAWIGQEIGGFAGLHIVLLITILTIFVIFATEVTSNIATASTLTPIILALGISNDLDPVMLAMPLALAASCAFMLPMATGPNAVAFATNRLTLPRMASAGLWLNVLSIPIIVLISVVLAPQVFGE